MIDRHAYQLEVERLLSQIESATHDLRFLKAGGVRRAGLADRKHDLADARARLASLVSAGPQPEALAA
jgi:hypothetical protein